MRKILTRLTLILVFCIGVSAFSKLQSQIVVAKWHFDNPTKQDAITDNASFASSPYTADDGIVENKDIATISLGGSVNYSGWVTGASGTPDQAPNSNAWNLTDGYWQIGIVTTGYKDLTLSSKQRSSSTGPTDFQIQYSTDNGSSWLDVGTAITVANNFTSGVVTDLALPAECNNLANLLIRWTNTSNVSVGGATVASGGTNRIDDIVVMGAFNDPCIATVPFFEGFEDGYTHATTVGGCWTQESVSGSQSWVVNSTNTTYNRTPRTGLFNATLQYSNEDWLFHKVYLTQGIVYDFSVWARQDATSGALLTLAWGAENNAAAMTNIIVNEQAIINDDYQEVRGTFTVPTDGVYYIGIKGTTTSSPWHLSIDDISLDFGPTCVAPENIQASNITSDATTITWDASITSVAAYNVYSSDVNTAPADDIANSEYTEVSGVTTTLGGLTPNTTYYVWVRSDCSASDMSSWGGPVEFTTSCAPDNIPYYQDFESVTAGNIPECTKVVQAGSGNMWTTESAPGYGFTNMCLKYGYSYSNAANSWYFTNGLNLQEGVSYRLTYKYGTSSTSSVEKLKVTYGTSASPSDVIATIVDNPNISNNVAAIQVIDFTPTTSGIYYIGFNVYSAKNQFLLFVDDISVELSPTCIEPTSLTVSNSGLSSATITWVAPTSGPTPAGYHVYYSQTNTAPADEISGGYEAIDVNSITLNTLESNSTYYVWVRSNCDGTDFSVWAGPVEVTTPMVVTPPWSEGFSSTTVPTGWTTSNMFLSSSNSAINSGGASGYYLYKNLYTSSNTCEFSTVTVGPIVGTEDLSFDYKLANYSSPYAPPVSGSGNFVVEISTDFGNTWSEIETVSNNGVAGWQTKAYDLSTYVNTGDFLKFRITANWISGDYYIAFDNFNLTSCMPVAALSATDLTENTATVSWIASSSNPGNYQVYVSTLNIAPADDETDVQTTDTASIDLTGLNNNPVHYIWVRADCGAGDYSTWTGPLTVWTSCVPLAGLPYEENFDSYGTGSSAFPNCWARPVTYSGYPYIVSAYSASSPASLRFNSSTTDPTYAISPAFAEDIHNLRVSFKLKASSTSSSGTIDVGVMSDPTDINTFETVATITPTNTSFNYYYYDLYSTTLSGANNHIAFRHNATSTSSYYWLDDFKVELSPSCIEPANLATNNLTTNSIDLSWTPLLTPPTNGYDIYLSLNNTAPTVSTTATYNTGNAGYYTINGLDAQTTYYVWLRSICSVGDTSAWAIPVTFTTLCAPESTLPYTQNFDSYSSGEYPDCWLRPVINSGFPSIVSGSSYYVSSPNGLKFQSLTTTPTYAISPAFSEDIQNLRVKFQLRAESTTSSGTIELGVMSDPYDLSTFESVAIIQPENTSFNAYQYDLYSTTLSGENRHIAFKHNSNANNYYFWLDNFEVDLSPTCIEPNGFAVNSVTANSATISWTASTSNPASYQVYCSINNTAPAEDETNVETTPENTIDLSGLSETTQYYVWVRSDCGASDFSAWGEPLEFTTLCYPADVPFFEGFENGYNHDDVVEGCWTQESLAGAEFWTANQTYVDYNRTPRTGSFNAFLGYNNTDWLFYRVNLIQGQAYDFTVWARQDATSGALLTLAWGAENNAAAMTNIIVNEQAIINGDYQEVRGTFTVPTDGVYYIGIKGTLNYTPWYLSIDDISLDFGPTCVEPTAIVASEITANSANISWTASVSAPASYHVYYSTTNTAPADDIADAEYAEVTGLTTELSELTPVTTYYVWVRSACGADENSVWTGISFETTPSCFEPTNIQASDITINSANISWTAATESPDATYHVYYSLVDAAPADDIDIAECEAPATNSIELTDLTSSSTYYVWVRSVCGADDFSTWAGPSVFSTSCAIISEYPYFEGFNSGIDPACWTIIDNDNSGDSWYSGTYASTPSYEGASMMVSEFSYPNDDWLISPQFKITSDNLKVDFYAKSYSAYFYESFNVLISKTGTSPSDFTIVLENIVDHPNTWQNHEYILSEHGINIDDEIYVAIQHVSNDQFVLFIDAFTVSEIEIPSAEAEILTYSIPNQVGEAEINSGATEGTITVTMPYDTEVANLVANFTLSYGATAKVDTEDQASGVTPNNFTDPVVYAVTAQDGSTIKNWTVTVNLEDAPSSEANILTYSFAEQYSPAVIDDVNHTVTVVVNEGTSLDALVATFTLSPGASAKIGAVDQESGVTENNFTDPVIYTVTAEDGTTTQPWTVTVSVYVGIEDVENSALAIYPNPNNGNFTLDFTNINGKVNYQIYDTKGSIIISDDFVANGSAIKEVSLNLVPGVYFVRLVTETQSLVEKLVVE